VKNSYTAIKREIEELEAQGFDRETIKAILQAKYKESNIERIKTKASWEKEEKMDTLIQKREKQKKTEEFWGKAKPYITVASVIIGFLVYIFFIAPAVDSFFEVMESLVE